MRSAAEKLDNVSEVAKKGCEHFTHDVFVGWWVGRDGRLSSVKHECFEQTGLGRLPSVVALPGVGETARSLGNVCASQTAASMRTRGFSVCRTA